MYLHVSNNLLKHGPHGAALFVDIGLHVQGCDFAVVKKMDDTHNSVCFDSEIACHQRTMVEP